MKMREEKISITIHDKEYVGRCVIEGTNIMRQTIHYKELFESDNRTYVLGQNAGEMYPHARALLAEMVFKKGLDK